MRIIIIIFLFFLASGSKAQTAGDRNSEIHLFFKDKTDSIVGKPFPSFEVKDSNLVLASQDLKGKVVLVNFWFEGCQPCMAEMKALTHLQEKLKDNKDFLFISFTWDKDEAINRVKDKYGINFKVFKISPAESKRLNFKSGYPTSLVLDRNGLVQFAHIGGPITPDDAEDVIMSELYPEIMGLIK